VRRQPTSFYLCLNPATKLVVALGSAAIAFAGHWSGPIVVLLASAFVAWRARLVRRSLRYLLASTPLLASILLVNGFLYPGAGDPILTIGPLGLTMAGLAAGLQAALRVLAFVASIAVFSLTTPTDDLLADLERRGLGRRATYVIGSAIGTLPAMLERARQIADAQRARGLDSEGAPWRRVRGILPLAGPLISGSIADVEERSLALEARGFSAPVRRTVLRGLRDSPRQRLARWAIGIVALAVVAGSVSSTLPLP
jgi:energy-coupling factor transport system permease protein